MRVAPGTPLDVSLHWGTGDEQRVGRLAWRNRVAWLEYDDAFLRSGLELSPVRHRVESGLHTPYDASVFEGLHGVFDDSLPDGWGRLLLDRRARQIGIDPFALTPLDRLACVGGTGMGALVYAPATDPWGEAGGTADLDRLAAGARRVLEGAMGDVISELGRVGGSPGGARPKVLIAINEAGRAVQGDIPEGYAPWLVKFANRNDPEDIARVEQAYALMAGSAGVALPPTRLLPGDRGRHNFAARRFDRDGSKRRHVHSASGLLYADFHLPSLDYRDLIALAQMVTRDSRDCNAMFKLAVFNVLAHNRDDHARQFSFLMERDGTWRLAPAYDLTFARGPGGEHTTSVLGHGKDIARSHLLDLGMKAGLAKSDCSAAIVQVEQAVADWGEFARDCDVGRSSRELVAQALASVRLAG